MINNNKEQITFIVIIYVNKGLCYSTGYIIFQLTHISFNFGSDKESVLRAMKYANSSACPSPCPSLNKEPRYLFNDFATTSQQSAKSNQFNEYIRVTVKNPMSASDVRRKSATPGSGKTRKLGLTRGNTIASFSLEDEQKYIRNYLWNNQNR